MRRPRRSQTERIPLAQLVDLLWRHTEQRLGRRLTYRSVARSIGESGNNLQKIRVGTNTNPGIQTLRSLSEFCGVTLAYFDCQTKAAAEVHLGGEEYNTRPVSPLEEGIAQLSDPGRRLVAAIIDYMLFLKSVPPKRRNKKRPDVP